MDRRLRLLGVALDAVRAEREGPAGIERRQRQRLADLVEHARTRSPYYRRHYAGLPGGVSDPALLPPTSKPELMAHFDEWVTDPRVTLEGLRRDLLGDPALVGQRYVGRYHVVTTSGTTGHPAVLLHDRDSWLVLGVVSRVRVRRAFLTWEVLSRMARQGLRVAALYAAGGHFGAAVLVEDVRRRARVLARHVRLFSVLRPLPELVADLEVFRPTVLSGYPSVVTELAAEQRAGRLHLRPLVIMVAGEELTATMRTEIESAFGCGVIASYAASEVPGLALPCREGALHVNADWYLLEPVDENGRPVPAGTPSSTVLVTNLANRVQPVIRYDLGDRVTVASRPCRCGSPLPVVTVEGRTNDVLVLESGTGEAVTILPLAVETVVEQTPGVSRFQVVQTGPRTLSLRLVPEPGSDPATVRARVETALLDYLRGQGAGSVTVEHDPAPPRQETRSGKLRHVLRAS